MRETISLSTTVIALSNPRRLGHRFGKAGYEYFLWCLETSRAASAWTTVRIAPNEADHGIVPNGATTGGCPYEPFFAHYQTHMTTAVVVDYCRDKREWPAL